MSDVKPVAWMPDVVFEALALKAAVNACVSAVKLIPEDVPLYSQESVTALQAEIESLRKDAERYRWLRDNPEHESAPYFDGSKWCVPCMTSGAGGFGGGVGEHRYETLDAPIDAAIAKERAK